jgi:hypothetical protein
MSDVLKGPRGDSSSPRDFFSRLSNLALQVFRVAEHKSGIDLTFSKMKYRNALIGDSSSCAGKTE